MSGPFILIATNKLKEGELEDEGEAGAGLVEFIQENEPGSLRSTNPGAKEAPK